MRTLAPLLLFLLFFSLASMGISTQEGDNYSSNFYRDGDLALYIMSAPIYYEYYYVWNGSIITEGVVYNYTNPIVLQFAVWNATGRNPIYIDLDGKTFRIITREGLFLFFLNLSYGIHFMVFRSKNMIFYQAVFNVIPKPVEKYITLTIWEYKLRINQAMLVAFQQTLLGSLVGVGIGILIKRQFTLVTNYIVLSLLFAPITLAFLDAAKFIVIGFSIVGALSYFLVPEKLSTIIIAKIDRDHPEREGEIYFIDVLEGTNYIPDRWFNGLRRKHRKLEKLDVYPMFLSGMEFIVAREIKEEGEKTIIIGDPQLSEAFIDAHIVERYSDQLLNALIENTEWRKTYPVKLKKEAADIFWSFIVDYFEYLKESGMITEDQIPKRVREAIKKKMESEGESNESV